MPEPKTPQAVASRQLNRTDETKIGHASSTPIESIRRISKSRSRSSGPNDDGDKLDDLERRIVWLVPTQIRTRGSRPTGYGKRDSGRMLPDRFQRTLKSPSNPPQNWTWTTISAVLKWRLAKAPAGMSELE
jgi:hypothetical protein